MAEKTKIVRTSNTIETGIFKIDKTVDLSKIKSLEVIDIGRTSIGDAKYKNLYRIIVNALHPEFKNISFTFDFDPKGMKSYHFKNAKGDGICMGTTPNGEIKDIVISSLSHESYAFQLSKKVSAWVHAETNPHNGEYLLWHYIYYGKYSPRLKWVLPQKCIDEKLWKLHKCKLCSGSKCEYLQYVCQICGSRTKNICPVCKTGICDKHSKCKNGHYVLTKNGMFEGKCRDCGTIVNIGLKKCQQCGGTNIRDY